MNIQKIILMAQRAPSGDNCQPFRFAWTDPVLQIRHDFERAQHFLNFNNLASRISLGSVMELVDIAASEQGYKVDWQVFAFNEAGCETVARGVFKREPHILRDSLIDFIEKRNCHRRLYDKSQLTAGFLNDFQTIVKTNRNIQMHLVSHWSDEITQFSAKIENIIWTNQEAVGDTFKWVRWSKAEYQQKRDGLYWRELGAKLFEFPIIRSIGRWPMIPSMMVKLGLSGVFEDVVMRNIKSSSALVLLSGSVKDPLLLESVGRLATRLWLKATEHEMVMQPLTVGPLLVLGKLLNALSPQVSKQWGGEIEKGHVLFKNEFQLKDEYNPVWMLRLGRPRVKVTPTLRKATEDVFST